MNPIMTEIRNMLDKNCKGCKVSKTLVYYHGQDKRDEYCKKLCLVGKKMKKLSIELEFGNDAKEGLKLDEETYLLLKKQGKTDKEIYTQFKISRNTLARRKKHWKVEPEKPQKRIEALGKTKKDYLELKVQNFSDKQIAKHWGIGNNTLLRWKRENNLRGGLETFYKLDEQGRTKKEYLGLKLQDLTDREVARLWGVSRSTLTEWKKRNYIRGGL